MARWRRGEATIETMLAAGELQPVTGAAADGTPWLDKAHRTLGTARVAAGSDPDSAWTLAYDAARFACVALLAQQGLRATTRGGHVAVEKAVREQFAGQFDRFGALRRQRNEIEYPLVATASLTRQDAETATALAAELIDAANRLLPNLGLFGWALIALPSASRLSISNRSERHCPGHTARMRESPSRARRTARRRSSRVSSCLRSLPRCSM